MKNIMLIGISRTGKSTFANMLKNKYPNYNIINADMIKKAFQQNFDDCSELKNNVNYRKFVKDFFKFECFYNDNNFILDTVDILPSDIEIIDKEQFEIIAFGCPSISVDEMLKIWYKTDNKWLLNKNEDEIREKAIRCIQKSNEFREECKKFNIKFIDTSYNREKTLNELLEQVFN